MLSGLMQDQPLLISQLIEFVAVGRVDGKLVVARTSDDGSEYFLTRSLSVELPVGAKPTDAVYESRLKQIAAAAEKAGIQHSLFPDTDDESDR